MNIDCEEVVKSVLPAFRRMIASHLIHDYNLSQTETAKLLETSQAVVSYYISSKRGKKIEYYSSLEDLKNMAIKSAGQLATGQTKMGMCLDRNVLLHHPLPPACVLTP